GRDLLPCHQLALTWTRFPGASPDIALTWTRFTEKWTIPDIFGLSNFYFHKSKLEWIDHEFGTRQRTCFHLPSSTHFLLDAPKPSSSTLEFQEYSPNLCHISMASGISASLETENLALTGVVFQPFDEFKKEDFDIPVTPQVSLARQKYTDDCEAAINEQINVEYSVSYVYHSLYAYFDRDNIALKGLTKRENCLLACLNIRGGRVKLHPILMPLSEFEHAEKGDALYAVELALSLEKLINEKLPSLHNVILLNLKTEYY
ncbi:hypothetical protein E1A91_D04G157900v1, partial [Gossypium mustelinum]